MTFGYNTIQLLTLHSMLIISDFSKTFTNYNIPSTWSSFARSGSLGDNYIRDRDALFDANFHYEQSGDMFHTNIWFREHARLFVEYGLTRDMIETLVQDDRYYAERPWVRELLSAIREQGHTLVIVSSGFADVIRAWFDTRGIDRTGIEIIANEFIFDATGLCSDIWALTRTPLDKYTGTDALVAQADILLGDSSEDIPVGFLGRSFGFTDEDRGFSVKLGKEGSMEAVIQYLK